MATREISTSIKLDGEKAFNDQMKAVNNNLKNLRSEMAVVTSEFADNADSVEALTAKQKNLTQQVDQQKVKVAALAKAYEDQASAFGENSAQADKYKQAMNQAQATLNKMEKELGKTNNELEDHKKKLEEANKAESKTAKIVEALKKTFTDAQPEIAKVSSALGATGKAAGALSVAGGAAVAALGALSAVGVAKMAQFAKEAAEDGVDGFGTLAVNMATLDNAAASAKNALGGVLLPTLEELSADGTVLLKKFSKEIEAAGNDPEKLSAAFSNLIKNAVTEIRRELPQMAELGMSLVVGLADGALESAPELFATGQEMLEILLDGIENNADSLADGALMLVDELAIFLAENAPELTTAAAELLASLVFGLAENAPQLVPAAIQLIIGLTTALMQNAPLLISSGIELVGGILLGILNALPDLIKFVPEMYQMIQDAVDSDVQSLLNIGGQIINTILQGLKNAWANVQKWFADAVAGLKGNASIGITTSNNTTGQLKGLDYVQNDGFMYVHKGEMIVSPSDAQILRTGKATGSTTTVNIYTQSLSESQIDYLYKRFNAQLGAGI